MQISRKDWIDRVEVVSIGSLRRNIVHKPQNLPRQNYDKSCNYFFAIPGFHPALLFMSGLLILIVLAKKVSKLHPKKYSSPYPSPPQIVFDFRLGKQCNLRDLWQCNRIVENWAETRITTSKRMLHGERELQDSVQSTNSSDTG